MNMMPKMIKPFMTQFSSNFKSALFCLHASAYSSGVYICYFANSRATALFLVAPHRDECLEHLSRVVTLLTLLTVEQLLYWSDWICTGRAAQIEAKTKLRFGNIVPNQWTLSGFVQHTTVLTQCTMDDNKISRQQKVLHMKTMLERVPHFQTSFSVGIQPQS